MTKTKAKKTAKGAAPTKKPAAAGKTTTKKQSDELSDDDLKQVSGGIMLANISPSPTQAAPSGGKWIELDSYSFNQSVGSKWLPR